MARKLPCSSRRTRPDSQGHRDPEGEAHLNISERRACTAARILFGILTLAAGQPAFSATIESPLHHPARRGPAVLRAAAVGEGLLDLDSAALLGLRGVGRGEPVRLRNFPFAAGATGDLVLERFEVAAPEARILVQTPHGAELRPLPDVAHFRGHLDGESDSRVYVAAQPAFLVAVVKTSAGLVYVGPEGPVDGPVQHVLRGADSPLNQALSPDEWHCGQEDLPPTPADTPVGLPQSGLRPASASATLAVSSLKDATLSIETDQELLAKFAGNVSSMSAYITTLVGQISVIYERDVAVHLTVNLIHAWTTTDPYAATIPRTQLDEVGDWWHANLPKASYPRTVVHYMSGKPVTGGIAWLDVLCQGDFSQGGHWGGGYGVTQVNGIYPANLWDLIAVSHELGHNFGSPHTHCFSPAIDQCYASETGCYSGAVVNPGPLGGTIMSYCHLLSGGFGNIDLRFHDRCITEQMLPEINSVTCLTSISDLPPAATSFYTVAPCRVVDTRNTAGPYGGPALSANSDRTFSLWEQCGVPLGSKAVSLNLTVTEATAAGDLRLYPAGIAMRAASAINYRVGETRANNQLVRLGATGGLAVRCDQSSGNVQVIIDVNGYFQ